jgi:hypothetical protein
VAFPRTSKYLLVKTATTLDSSIQLSFHVLWNLIYIGTRTSRMAGIWLPGPRPLHGTRTNRPPQLCLSFIKRHNLTFRPTKHLDRPILEGPLLGHPAQASQSHTDVQSCSVELHMAGGRISPERGSRNRRHRQSRTVPVIVPPIAVSLPEHRTDAALIAMLRICIRQKRRPPRTSLAFEPNGPDCGRGCNGVICSTRTPTFQRTAKCRC